MLAFPHIKINLGLYITEKRPDNYHNILTCFYPIAWNDVLEIVPSKQFEFVQTGLIIPGNPAENLCVKAYELLKSDFDLPPVRLHLHKIVPMGAGLGGGSSDASFTLSTLSQQFGLGLKEPQLEEYAAKLGSDCAFFIRNRPVIAQGKGEMMEDIALNLKGTYILLVCPAVHAATSTAYNGVKPAPYQDDFVSLLMNRALWKDRLHNQFEDTIFPNHPVLSDIKHMLYEMGAWYAAMSGSGSTVFGLFDHKIEKNPFPFLTFEQVL